MVFLSHSWIFQASRANSVASKKRSGHPESSSLELPIRLERRRHIAMQFLDKPR